MKKLFTNDKFFLITFLVTVVSLVSTMVVAIVQGGSRHDFLWRVQAIFLLCEIFLFLSYQHHNKNLMKCMIGATLMAIIMDGYYWNAQPCSIGAEIASGLYTIFAILLFVVHIFMNFDRRTNPRNIKLNYAFLICFAASDIMWLFFYLADGATLFNGLCLLLFSVGMATTIVCIEARLESYRTDREAAGWTEETGYPEGYVHEFEKK